MRNIFIFLIHFSIISQLTVVLTLHRKVSQRRPAVSAGFVSNRTLYKSTFASGPESGKTDQISNNGLESHLAHTNTHGEAVKTVESPSTEVKTRLEELRPDSGKAKTQNAAINSPNEALKSIIHNGAIRSSSVRHDILDKESLLDDLIASNDNVHSDLEPGYSGDSLSTIKPIRGRLEKEFKEMETSVFRKTAEKKEQVIKPSKKSLKRSSKDSIYTKMQNLVKSSEHTLAKHGLLEEAKGFVHLFHWNVWHTASERGRECNWTPDQFKHFRELVSKIDGIVNSELASFFQTTSSTDKDLISDLVEKRLSFLFSSHNAYNRLRELVSMSDFYAYRNRMADYYRITNRLTSSLKRLASRLRIDPHRWSFYNRWRARYFRIKSRLKTITSNLINKFNHNRIFTKIAKFTPSAGRAKSHPADQDDLGESWRDSNRVYERLTVPYLLNTLSHEYISPQNLKDTDEIGRGDLYKLSKNGVWSLSFVGSGSRQPTSSRLTSTMAYMRNGRPGVWLFDCGEGTKNGLEAMGIDPHQVDRVFLTHLHGDHCYGLFSFLYMRERAKPLVIYGPPGTRKLIGAIHQNTSTSTYNNFIVRELIPKVASEGAEVQDNSGANSGTAEPGTPPHDLFLNSEGYFEVFADDDVEVLAAELAHSMTTVGYVIQQKRGTANPAIHLRGQYGGPRGSGWTDLDLARHQGGPPRPGQGRGSEANPTLRKIVICQDSSDSSKMAKIARDADLLVHEATLSPATSLVSGVLMDMIREEDSVVLSSGSIKRLNAFLSSMETQLGCFNFTLSALSSFVKCERYYLLEKLNVLKNFVDTFRTLEQMEVLNEAGDGLNLKPQGKERTKKELERELKERWLEMVCVFMDRLNALVELGRNEFFVGRLSSRYQLMQKLSQVVPSIDLARVIDVLARRFLFSSMLRNHNPLNAAYAKYAIDAKYRAKNVVNVGEYLNGVFNDIVEYWAEILQLPGHQNRGSPEIDWTGLYNRIIGSFGHSTPNMAGRFAREINAKKLVLTHFSNRYPGDDRFESLLTMIRIENEARLGYGRDRGSIPVVAAWDRMRINI